MDANQEKNGCSNIERNSYVILPNIIRVLQVVSFETLCEVKVSHIRSRSHYFVAMVKQKCRHCSKKVFGMRS